MSLLGFAGAHMLGKTNRENSGPSILRQRKSSALHLAVSGTFLMPARVFDSRTLIESFGKLIASHIRASASRWDRIPVSRIKITSARRKGGATARIFSSSSKVTICGVRRFLCLRKSTSRKGFREMKRWRSASRIMRRRTRRSWLIVAGSTAWANRASLYSSIRSPEMSDSRTPANAAYSFPTEDPYRLRVFGCATFARNSSAHSTKGGGVDFGR